MHDNGQQLCNPQITTQLRSVVLDPKKVRLLESYLSMASKKALLF